MRDKDKRKTRRRPLRRCSAWLALGSGKLRDCKLSDVSEAGARIEMNDTGSVPDQFMLFLSNNGAARRSCHVVWRKAQQLGVKFKARRHGAKQPSRLKVGRVPGKIEPAESA
jgi:hypothetical protein